MICRGKGERGVWINWPLYIVFPSSANTAEICNTMSCYKRNRQKQTEIAENKIKEMLVDRHAGWWLDQGSPSCTCYQSESDKATSTQEYLAWTCVKQSWSEGARLIRDNPSENSKPDAYIVLPTDIPASVSHQSDPRSHRADMTSSTSIATK